MDDMEVVWVKKFGPFMWGRIDALDDGWSHKGKLITFRIVVRKSGIALLTRKRQYSFFWSKP